MKHKSKKIDCDLYQYAFDKWLNSRISEGEYSEAAVGIFGQYKADPLKAFRRRRNDSTSWKLKDLCCLACYLKIDLAKIMDEIMVIYRMLDRTAPAKKNRR